MARGKFDGRLQKSVWRQIRVLILSPLLSFSGTDHGHAVSATAAGLVLRVSSNQASQLRHLQYKNAASIYFLSKEPMEGGEKISLRATIKTMRLMECKVTAMMEVVLSILLGL